MGHARQLLNKSIPLFSVLTLQAAAAHNRCTMVVHVHALHDAEGPALLQSNSLAVRMLGGPPFLCLKKCCELIGEVY